MLHQLRTIKFLIVAIKIIFEVQKIFFKTQHSNQLRSNCPKIGTLLSPPRFSKPYFTEENLNIYFSFQTFYQIFFNFFLFQTIQSNMRQSSDNFFIPTSPATIFAIPISEYSINPSYPILFYSLSAINSGFPTPFALHPNSPYMDHGFTSQNPIRSQNVLQSTFTEHLDQNRSKKLCPIQQKKQKREGVGAQKEFSKKYPLQRSRKKFIKKQTAKNMKQDPQRNIVTNIGNQLLTFTTNKARCFRALETLSTGSDKKDLSGFFAYSRRLRGRVGYYLNFSKMRTIWYPKEVSPAGEKHQRMLRTLSYLYLTQMFRLIVLNSAKMQKKSKGYHLKAIRKLIKNLRNPP